MVSFAFNFGIFYNYDKVLSKFNVIIMSSINNKRIAKNTMFLYFRMLLIMLVTLYTSRVVLKALGIEDFGIYNVVGGFVSMLSFLNTSIASGFQRFFNIELGKEQLHKVKRMFSVSLSIQIGLSLLILFLAETVGLWFLNVQMNIPPARIVAANWVYQCSILMLIFALFRAPYDAIIIANEKMDFYAYIGICEVAFKFLVAYSLVKIPHDALISYAMLMTLITGGIFVCYIFFIHVKFKYLRFSPIIDRELMKRMLGFSGWNILGSLSHLMKGQGVNILLNIFGGPAINAARGIAYQIQSGVTVFVGNFQLAARPQMIKSYAVGDILGLMTLFYRISRLSFLLLWLIALPLLFKMDFTLILWLGADVPALSSLFAILSMLISLTESLAPPLTTIVHATGHMKMFQTVCSSIILSIVPLSYVVLKMGLPPESVMYVSLFVLIIVHGVRLYLLKKLVIFSVCEYIVNVLFPCVKVVVVTLLFAYVINLQSIDMVMSVVQILLTLLLTAITIVFVGLNVAERSAVLKIIVNCYGKLKK